MNKRNVMYITAFILIGLLFAAFWVQFIGSRYIIMSNMNKDAVVIFLKIIGYVNRALSYLLILNLIVITVVEIIRKSRRAVWVMAVINVGLALMIEVSKYSFAAFAQRMISGKTDMPFGWESIGKAVGLASYGSIAVNLILYISIIVLMMISMNMRRYSPRLMPESNVSQQ